MKVAIAFGTRPEIIKLGPIVEEVAQRDNVQLRLINTAQHFDWAMSGAFLDGFAFPTIDHTIAEVPGRGAARLGHLIAEIGRVLELEGPDCLLVQGDTVTALAGALAGAKSKTPVGHVEAGLRSFNPQSPEELNRRIIGQTATVHFAPTALNGFLLQREGVPAEAIEIVGNPVVDALRRNQPRIAEARSVLSEVELGGRPPVLVTVHRPGNTDNPARLAAILEAFLDTVGAHFLFPMHPRTRRALAEIDSADPERRLGDRIRAAPNVTLLDPLSYLEFAKLLSESALVVTDSGGVQEEANTLGKPVITLRPSTPRWEGILAGVNRLSPTERDAISEAVMAVLHASSRRAGSAELYGDGHAAPRIVNALLRRHENGSLIPDEPRFYADVPAPVRTFSRR